MLFRIAVLLGAAIATAVGAVIYPYMGTLVMVYLVFGRPQDDRPNVAPLHIPMMITTAVLIGTFLKSGSMSSEILAGIKRLRFIWVLYAMMATSTLVNWNELSKGALYDFSTLMCLCLLTLIWVTVEQRLRGYALALVGSGAYVMLRVIRNPSHIHEEIGGDQFARMAIAKGGTVFGNSNYLALWMVMTIFLALAMMIVYRKFWQRATLLSIAGGAGYVFFRANSRGASLALAFTTFVLWLLQKRKFRSAVVIMVLVGAAASLAPTSYWERLKTIATYQEDASATSRLELWNIALDLIPRHPLFGVGPNNFELHAFNSPHNAYIQMAVEDGIPAFFVYVMILISGVYFSLRARSMAADRSPVIYAVAQGAFCCLLVDIVQGFTTGLAHREVVYGFATLAYCVHALAAKLPPSEQEESGTAGEIGSGAPSAEESLPVRVNS